MDVCVDASCSKAVLKGKSAAEVGSKRKTHEIGKKKVQQEQSEKSENKCKKNDKPASWCLCISFFFKMVFGHLVAVIGVLSSLPPPV